MSMRCARILRRAVSRAPLDVGWVMLGRSGKRSLERMLCFASAMRTSRCVVGARAASPQAGHHCPLGAAILRRLRSRKATVGVISGARR